MKWFKHHSDAALNDKLGKLEAKYGLIGYAVYFKIVEICALNWDEKSDPLFSFDARQIKSRLSLNYIKIESILSLCSVLNLFTFKKSEKNYEIYFPKIELIKKRYQKKDVAEESGERLNDHPNKNKDNKNKDKKENSDFETVVAGVYDAYSFTEGYPKHVIDEVAKEAYPIFLADTKPDKDWKRFLIHYVKNNKSRIRDYMLDSREEKSYSDHMKEIFGGQDV